MIIIPAIDLRNGCCVRLFQGDFDQETSYSDQPSVLLREYEQMGFDYLHLVDLDGARDGVPVNEASVSEIIAASSMSVQLGGGIRHSRDVRRWLDAGIEKCVVGSAAVSRPDSVKEWIREFSAARIVLALDVRITTDSVPMIATHGWTREGNVTLWNCVERFLAVGLTHVLCTDIERDGALSGPNIELYNEFVQRYPAIQLQASGGIRDIADIVETAKTGAAAAITGRALLDGRISSQDISSFRLNA